jgi:G:T-mismatch repair DNA endonuclease (very short patch repair protein)
VRDTRKTAAHESTGGRGLFLLECKLKNDEALRAVLKEAVDMAHVT